MAVGVAGQGGLEDCQVEVGVRATKQQLLTRAGNPENRHLTGKDNMI